MKTHHKFYTDTGEFAGSTITGDGFKIVATPDGAPVVEIDKSRVRLVPMPAAGDGEMVERFRIEGK
jgi:hypothetical protein